MTIWQGNSRQKIYTSDKWLSLDHLLDLPPIKRFYDSLKFSFVTLALWASHSSSPWHDFRARYITESMLFDPCPPSKYKESMIFSGKTKSIRGPEECPQVINGWSYTYIMLPPTKDFLLLFTPLDLCNKHLSEADKDIRGRQTLCCAFIFLYI